MLHASFYVIMLDSADLNAFFNFSIRNVPIWPFAIVGVFVIVSSVVSTIYRFIFNIWTRILGMKNFRSFGSWAVVTGASDGIGQAYAEQLAKQGMNVMLISRTASRVSAVAKQLQIEHPNVQVRWLAVDFSQTDIYEKIENELKILDIGILVNNVGMACDDIQYFWETSRQFVQTMLNVNLVSMVMMTHIVMPKMAAKNKGIIINVASVAGQLPPYLFAMYGSTKKYMKHFSYALQLETATACPGVIVQDLSPWFVATKMARLKGQGNVFIPAPTDYVASSLCTIGIPFTHGHFSHELQGFLTSLLPTWLHDFIVYQIAKSLRKLAIHNKKKAAEEAAKQK